MVIKIIYQGCEDSIIYKIFFVENAGFLVEHSPKNSGNFWESVDITEAQAPDQSKPEPVSRAQGMVIDFR